MLEIVDRHVSADPSELLPALTPDTEPFWTGLSEGRLQVQHCLSCERCRFPIVPVCPYCGDVTWQWRELDGTGRIFSWVRYQRGYLAEFAELMPYVVACVELNEGVRVFSLLANAPHAGPVTIGHPVRAQAERWPNGRCVLRFVML